MTDENITLDRECGLTLMLPPALLVGHSYRGTDETPLAGMEFTLLAIGEPLSDLDSGLDQYPVTVQVGAEVWDDVTLPEDAHVILLDPNTGEPMPPAPECQTHSHAGRAEPDPFACAECGTTTAETYVVTTLDPEDPATRTEVCRACDDATRTLTLAEVSTGKFSWAVVADGYENAELALLAAYRQYAETNPLADPDVMFDTMHDGYDLAEVTLGQVLMDGSPLPERITPTVPS